MSRSSSPTAALLLLALLGPLPPTAHAELYTVTLVHGATLETRYRPVLDPGDPDKVLLLTDQGNWIALLRRWIVKSVAEIERRGFGRSLDAVTVDVGWTPNSAAGDGSEPPADPTAALARALERRFLALADSLPYSVDQFVEPEAASGIPLPRGLDAMAPVGSPARFVSPQSRP